MNTNTLMKPKPKNLCHMKPKTQYTYLIYVFYKLFVFILVYLISSTLPILQPSLRVNSTMTIQLYYADDIESTNWLPLISIGIYQTTYLLKLSPWALILLDKWSATPCVSPPVPVQLCSGICKDSSRI